VDKPVDCIFYVDKPYYHCTLHIDTCPCERQETEEEARFEEAKRLFNDEINYKKTLCQFGGNSGTSGKKHKKPPKKKKFDYLEEV